MATKKATIQAKVEGVLTELLVKTHSDQVYFADGSNLTSQLAAIVADVALKANKTDVTAEISAAISALIDGAPETYDTLKEIATYIDGHQDVVDGLNAAIGNKADKTTVDALQTTVSEIQAAVALKANAADVYTKSEADNLLGAKANSADVYNKTEVDAAVKEVQDGVDALDARVEAVEGKAHTHANGTVLDGITAEKVSAWDAAEQNAKDYVDGKIEGLGALASKDTVAEADLDAELAAKINAATGEIDNLGALASKDEVTEAELGTDLANKINGLGVGQSTIYVQAAEPTAMTNNDLWIQITE